MPTPDAPRPPDDDVPSLNESTEPAPDSDAAEPRVWRSEELFGDRNEVLVLHGDMVYRLRRTRNGKLILHK